MAVWWLVAAWVLCTSSAVGYDATWPGCATIRGYTPFPELDPKLFNPHVTGIHFINCSFSSVHMRSLNVYPALTNIDLNDIEADVTDFQSETFPKLAFLTMRNVSFREKALPSNLFRNCHRLFYIDLRDNNRIEAPNDLLQGLVELKILTVVNFAARGLPSFFTSQTFSNLDLFQVENNGITKLTDPGTFTNAVNLTRLFLANNEIDYIHAGVLKPLTKIKTVILNRNRLRIVPGTLFQHKADLVNIDLSFNLIESIPLNAFLGTNLTNLYLNDNKLKHLTGNFLSNLLDTAKNLRMFKFFAKSWDCRCLNRVLVNIKRLKIDYDRSHFDGRHQACVTHQMSLVIDQCPL